MIKRPLKALGIAALLAAVITLIWATRTGKWEPKAYQDKGVLLPVTEETPWPPKIITVSMGIYIQKVYSFAIQSQTFSSEGWVWLIWSQDFQDLLNTEKIPIAEILTPVNMVQTSSPSFQPRDDNPIRLPDGRYGQIFSYYGQFSASGLNFRRFPFETLHFPLIFGLNPEYFPLNASRVRLMPDGKQFGLGEYTALPGYITTGKQVREFVFQFQDSLGWPAVHSASEARFSRLEMDVIYHTSVVAAFLQLFLPLTVVMAVVLLAPNLAGSLWDVRVALPSTALLTLIFLQQGYRSQLPSLPYLTFIDQVYALCYAVALVIFALFVSSSNHLDNASEADRPAVIEKINRTDLRFQIILTCSLLTLVTLCWLFPVR